MLSFDVEELTGSPREIGRQHGEGQRDRIRHHLEISRRRSSASPAELQVRALAYRPFVLAEAPWLDDELAGLAEGAGIDLADAYALQLRSELDATTSVLAAGGLEQAPTGLGECTTFATVEGGQALAGQNLDLPQEYAELMTIRRVSDPERPAFAMVAAAGQISHLGLNEHGVAVFASFLPVGGWRVGFPRYLYSRIALAHTGIDAATAAIVGLHRASSRSLLLADGSGRSRVLELTPTRHAVIESAGRPLVHTNHVESPSLATDDLATGDWSEDSRCRADRMRDLLRIGIPARQAAADRGMRWPISREPSDGDPDFVTVASAIATPALGRLDVASGPPHLAPYVSLEVGR